MRRCWNRWRRCCRNSAPTEPAAGSEIFPAEIFPAPGIGRRELYPNGGRERIFTRRQDLVSPAAHALPPLAITMPGVHCGPSLCRSGATGRASTAAPGTLCRAVLTGGGEDRLCRCLPPGPSGAAPATGLCGLFTGPAARAPGGHLQRFLVGAGRKRQSSPLPVLRGAGAFPGFGGTGSTVSGRLFRSRTRPAGRRPRAIDHRLCGMITRRSARPAPKGTRRDRSARPGSGFRPQRPRTADGALPLVPFRRPRRTRWRRRTQDRRRCRPAVGRRRLTTLPPVMTQTWRRRLTPVPLAHRRCPATVPPRCHWPAGGA